MSPLQALFTPDLLLAALVHLALLITLLAGFSWLGHHTQGIPVTDWLLEHVAHPLARAAVLVVFVLIAYPALFGLSQVPDWSELLAAERGRLQSLLNWVFLASLLLPLVPVLGRLQALVLPVQGMVACALLFSWLAQAQGWTHVTLWPSGPTAASLILLTLVTHALASLAARPVGAWIDQRFALLGAEALAFEAMVIVAQIPVILLYGLSLGAQLGA